MAQALGAVQHLKWLPGIERAFAYLNVAGSTELYYVAFDGATAADRVAQRALSITLARAAGAGLPVAVTHDPDQARVTTVDLRAPTIRVAGFEITQAVQDPAHSVGLIAGKRTVVRVLLTSAGPGFATVTGTLRVKRAGQADVLVAPEALATLDPADVGTLANIRASAAKSLNFVLPETVLGAGTISCSLDALSDAAGVPLKAAGMSISQSATFNSGTPLRVAIIGFTYTLGSPPTAYTPTGLDFDMLISWLRRAYPASEIITSQRVVTAASAPPFSCGQINAELAQIRALDVAGGTDGRTHYYGLVSDGGFFMRGCAGVPSSPNPAAMGSGPTGPSSWGWDNDGSYGDWYGGHEIGHTFGRLHPGFCGETHDDPAYPYVAGQLADTADSFVGFDVGDPTLGLGVVALPGTSWHDVMTYCPQEWLSAYTYDGIRARLAAEDLLSPGASPGGGREDQRYASYMPERDLGSQPNRLMRIIATLNLKAAEGRIVTLMPASSPTPADETAPAGGVQLRFLDSAGREVSAIAGQPLPMSDTEDADIDALLDQVVVVSPSATDVQLILGDSVTDQRAIGGRGAVMRHVDTRQGSDGWLEVSWDGDVAEGPSSYAIQLSRDHGRTWQTVAAGVTEHNARIHPSNLPPRGRLLVRVLSLDGPLSAAATAVHDLEGLEPLGR